MSSVFALQSRLSSREGLNLLSGLYCCGEEAAEKQAERYQSVLLELETVFGPHGEAALFSTPGRTEIGGNHTDHQQGCVLAAAVTADAVAAAGRNGLGELRVLSRGYGTFRVDFNDLSRRREEENGPLAILRGTCAGLVSRGARLTGLDVVIDSRVPAGSGLSSSAVFEVLTATVLSALCAEELALTPADLALIGQRTENGYFGKPSGLMDQMTCALGGAVAMDFIDPAHPAVRSIPFSLRDAGLSLVILDSGAGHENLTGEYAAVPAECRQVAELLGGRVLRDVPEAVFLERLPSLRGHCPDRALLRAMHFYGENERAQKEAAALEQGDVPAFLSLVNESGRSSYELLQNVIPAGTTLRQELALTLALAQRVLAGEGAVRVHGGGFAGTAQAFVPVEITEAFTAAMESLLFPGCCRVLSLRPAGSVRVM